MKILIIWLSYYYPFDKDIIIDKFKDYSLNYSKYVITKYVTNVNLIKNKKYDLKLYILITSLKPLRIYLYKDGLVRIASKKYSLDINSMGDKYIHLTNTEVNKYNKYYINPKNYSDENTNMEFKNMPKTFKYK